MDTGVSDGDDQDNIPAWRDVLVPSFTVLLTGAESAFMDFVFLPELLSSKDLGLKDPTKDVNTRFEDFIISLFDKVASSETTVSGQRYVRQVDFHKLEEEEIPDKYTYFFRHCGSTRLCVKLNKENSKRYLLYGYCGQGLHRSHPSWTSLVVRSRDRRLSARLIAMLFETGLACESFVNAVPSDCKYSYKSVLRKLNDELIICGTSIDDLHYDSASDENDVEEHASASEESNVGGCLGDESSDGEEVEC